MSKSNPKTKKRLRKVGTIFGVFSCLLLSLGFYVTINNMTVPLYGDKAVAWIGEHAKAKSSNMCALHVCKALNEGDKITPLLPAWAYKYWLPLNGFARVPRKGYKPVKADIVVFPPHKRHIFGHIAMYDGKKWVSDFRQKSVIVSKAYSPGEAAYFRDPGAFAEF